MGIRWNLNFKQKLNKGSFNVMLFKQLVKLFLECLMNKTWSSFQEIKYNFICFPNLRVKIWGVLLNNHTTNDKMLYTLKKMSLFDENDLNELTVLVNQYIQHKAQGYYIQSRVLINKLQNPLFHAKLLSFVSSLTTDVAADRRKRLESTLHWNEFGS